jgi:hypothetical protein
MKGTYAALCVCLFALSILARAQEPPNPKPRPSAIEPRACLVVARYANEGSFAYRDQYGVPLEHVQPSYSTDELNVVMKDGIKVVVYDPREHESFYEARQSCFINPAQPPR